jgi:hypothetical protein
VADACKPTAVKTDPLIVTALRTRSVVMATGGDVTQLTFVGESPLPADEQDTTGGRISTSNAAIALVVVVAMVTRRSS